MNIKRMLNDELERIVPSEETVVLRVYSISSVRLPFWS